MSGKLEAKFEWAGDIVRRLGEGPDPTKEESLKHYEKTARELGLLIGKELAQTIYKFHANIVTLTRWDFKTSILREAKGGR